MTNPTIEVVKASTSFRKRFGINQQLFEIVMTKAESVVNRICGANELIYFCSSFRDHLNVETKLLLNVMGFDKDRLHQACKELYELFQQSADESNAFCILQDLDDVNDVQDRQADMEACGTSLVLPPTPVNAHAPVPRLLSPSANGRISPHEIRHSGDAEKICTPHGIQINVFHGDLVKQKTEAIVVITNSRLQCSTLPCKAVLAAIGSRHTDDCSSFLKAQGLFGQLKPCQVMHTNAGNMWPNVLHVIHAVQPKSEDLNEPQKQHSLLEDLCFNCLEYANTKLKVKSISTPFVITDHSTIMYPVVASAICKALLKYDQYITNGAEGSTLKEINVVCSDREAVIIQMKTFDVFLPKLIHGGHLQTPPCNLQTPPCNLQTPPCNLQTPTGNLQTPPGNLQTPPCISSSTEKFSETDFGISLFELKRCSNLRHVGSSLVKIQEEDWWKERINSNYDQLQLKISLDSGLEGELLKHDVFSTSTLQYSMEEESTPKKNRYLLNSLLQGDEVMFHNFCEALRLSGQDHIVSRYLSERAPCAPKQSIPRSSSEPAFSADLKLLQRWKFRNLNKFQNELIEKIICDCGLLSHLRSLQVFTEHQMAELESEKHETSRNRLMLKWLARSSEGTHEKFCEALKLNKQAHLVTNYLTAMSHSMVRCEKSVSLSTELLNIDKTSFPWSGDCDQPDFE